LKIVVINLIFSIFVFANSIVVVSNKTSDINRISLEELKNIYLKNIKSVNGFRIVPIDNKNFKNSFDTKILNKTPLQLNSYWAKMIFSGKSQPPVLLVDDKMVISKIESNKNSIGYIKKDNLNSNLKILIDID
jgi:ABC-type phosphate transport system substrate-binding protein